MDPQLIKRIHQLTGATGLTDEDLFLVSQLIGGVNKTRKIDLESLRDYVNENLPIAPNSGLVFEDGKLTTKFNTLIPNTTDNLPLGGAGATGANIWKEKNLVQTLDTLLFPDTPPTYIIPTLNLTSTYSGLVEAGTLIQQTLVLTGIKNDAGAYTALKIFRGNNNIYSTNSPTVQIAIPLPAEFNLPNLNNPNYSYTINYVDNFIVTEGTTYWQGKGDYSGGIVKKNNKAVDDTRSAQIRSTAAPQALASDYTSNQIAVTGYYPYFWGTASEGQSSYSTIAQKIANGFTSKVSALSSEDIVITFNADEEYIWFAMPTIYGSKTKWVGEGMNNGNIGNGEFISAYQEYPISSPDSLWSNVIYKIYISSWPTVTVGSLKFKN